MIFHPTPLEGLLVLTPERHGDARGHFARTWCAEELAAHGLDTGVAQCSTSYNHSRGTLRGLHLQTAPHEEAKLVRCTAGRIFDVAVDLRPESPTRTRWFGLELSAEEGNQLFIPRGFAHGFLTLDDATEVFYMISVPYAPDFQRGYHYQDPTFDIDWPEPVAVISDRDRDLPRYGESP